uniref:Sushi domain-containing protein n=1 Tax=Plectus sambesii TaxID=2011161 RepID=A0A914VBU7_9BILA
MSLSQVFLFVTVFLHGVKAQCGSTTIPTGTNVLQNVGVYAANDIYRVSVDSLTSSGFTALATSGKAKVATTDQTMCPLLTCMMELATNQKTTDKSILQQHNFLGGLAPTGYTLITPTTKMYCVKFQGDCGADVPLWRYYKNVGINGWVHAYSFDPSVAYAGYTRELAPVCYMWSTTTAVSTCGDGIAAGRLGTLTAYMNAANYIGANRDTWFTTQTSSTNPTAFSYQTYTKSADLTKVATSMPSTADTLQCNCLQKVVQAFDKQPGLFGTALAPGLGSRFDHKFYLESQPEANLLFEQYELTGEVFYCVLSRGTCGATVAIKKWFNIFEINTVYTIDGQADPGFGYIGGQVLCYTWATTYTSPVVCSVLTTTVTNGQISYVQAGTTTNYLQGTVAVLTCSTGYAASGTYNATCLTTGVWSPAAITGTCVQVCTAFNSDPFGTITYSATPIIAGTTATLTCNDTTKYAVNGDSSALCTAGAFAPTTLGSCTRTCPTLTITSGTVSTFLADGTTAATAPYFEGYTATFTCTAPSAIVGTARATCTNGAWVTQGSCSS